MNITLPFTRKPADIKEIRGQEYRKVVVIETKEMTFLEFDAFARDLLASHEWMDGKGGGEGDAFLCIKVTAPARPTLYINPEGGDYAKYVACVSN